MKTKRRNQVHLQPSARNRHHKRASPSQPEIKKDTGDVVLQLMAKQVPPAVAPTPSSAGGIEGTLKKLDELDKIGKALTVDAWRGLSARLIQRMQEEVPRINVKAPKDVLNMVKAIEIWNQQIHNYRGLEISLDGARQASPVHINMPPFKKP